jgi:hypothetical protein
MRDNGAIGSIIVGTIGIILALTIKQFYASDMYGKQGPPISRWKGQLLFGGVGLLFLVVGVAHLFTNR